MATVYIAIYEVYDERDPNHWALYILNSNGQRVILQVNDDKTGVGYYVEQPVYDKEPERSGRHKVSMAVGQIPAEYYSVAVSMLLEVPVDNVSSTWNCQAWVVSALDYLESSGVFRWDPAARQRVLGLRQHWQ
ncbi:hypothetical protein CCM_04160 [Cordyceps militaris CM01]|uniref:Uncharacterized protein n=1 Tax=Cordyceps militaris (strain CM01) TaxID=983644 RepID=G3JDW2_CORMM|nr:uncharacterized protein CCM_04160 [Cordyceps militaris CM01]EGX92787.1 hypothetical protein CCM_04160 [Cordyceps militaris CM01]